MVRKVETRLGRGVMPARKGAKMQPQKRIDWPVLDYFDSAEYRRQLEETRRWNLNSARYERRMVAQAEDAAERRSRTPR